MTHTPAPAEIETLRKIVNGELDRETDYAAIIAANKILDRLSPAPEVDEATKIWREMEARGWEASGCDNGQAASFREGRELPGPCGLAKIAALADIIASKDGEIEKIVKRESETVDQLETALSELATLRAENERPIDMILFCPSCHAQHVDEANGEWDGKPWNNPPHKSHLCGKCGCIWRPCDMPTNGVSAIQTIGKADTWIAAERNPAEPEHRLSSEDVFPPLEKSCAPLVSRSSDGSGAYGKVHTDGSRSGGMPPGTNAGAVEVTEADREATARALDTGSNSTTWEKLTASHRTPDQLWQAKRAAQAFARHRTEAEARGYTKGRREVLEAMQAYLDDKAGQYLYRGYLAEEIERMMTGEK